MQSFSNTERLNKDFNVANLSFDERVRLVSFFAWLITQDKKQSKSKNQKND